MLLIPKLENDQRRSRAAEYDYRERALLARLGLLPIAGEGRAPSDELKLLSHPAHTPVWHRWM